jgi:hypothetical protein
VHYCTFDVQHHALTQPWRWRHAAGMSNALRDGGQPIGHGVLQRAALAALADRFAQVAASRAILALPITP